MGKVSQKYEWVWGDKGIVRTIWGDHRFDIRIGFYRDKSSACYELSRQASGEKAERLRKKAFNATKVADSLEFEMTMAREIDRAERIALYPAG